MLARFHCFTVFRPAFQGSKNQIINTTAQTGKTRFCACPLWFPAFSDKKHAPVCWWRVGNVLVMCGDFGRSRGTAKCSVTVSKKKLRLVSISTQCVRRRNFSDEDRNSFHPRWTRKRGGVARASILFLLPGADRLTGPVFNAGGARFFCRRIFAMYCVFSGVLSCPRRS